MSRRYATFEEYHEAHTPVGFEVVVEQLRAIPVGRSGVAGLKGSRWDRDQPSPFTPGGGSVGPGVIVKRLEEDKFSWMGLQFPLLETARLIVSMYARPAGGESADGRPPE